MNVLLNSTFLLFPTYQNPTYSRSNVIPTPSWSYTKRFCWKVGPSFLWASRARFQVHVHPIPRVQILKPLHVDSGSLQLHPAWEREFTHVCVTLFTLPLPTLALDNGFDFFSSHWTASSSENSGVSKTVLISVLSILRISALQSPAAPGPDHKWGLIKQHKLLKL